MSPAVTGCPVQWVADLAPTSEPAQAPVIREGSPDAKEVREFFELYKQHGTLTDAEWRLRVQDVIAEIAQTGTYVLQVTFFESVNFGELVVTRN